MEVKQFLQRSVCTTAQVLKDTYRRDYGMIDQDNPLNYAASLFNTVARFVRNDQAIISDHCTFGGNQVFTANDLDAIYRTMKISKDNPAAIYWQMQINNAGGAMTPDEFAVTHYNDTANAIRNLEILTGQHR